MAPLTQIAPKHPTLFSLLGGLLFAIVASLATVQPVSAAGVSSSTGGGDGGYGNASKGDRFYAVNKALKKQQYVDAIALLKTLETDTPDDADVHNLLGFSNRKLGNFDVAYAHYQQALAIDPEHIRAHEYLGELYLQTDRLADAEAQLERVSELCSLFCKERRVLKKAIAKYKADNA